MVVGLRMVRRVAGSRINEVTEVISTSHADEMISYDVVSVIVIPFSQ